MESLRLCVGPPEEMYFDNDLQCEVVVRRIIINERGEKVEPDQNGDLIAASPKDVVIAVFRKVNSTLWLNLVKIATQNGYRMVNVRMLPNLYPGAITQKEVDFLGFK